MARRARQDRRAAGTIRIIGGHWRGRRFPVPEEHGLRPTGDRVRETLFNWLAPRLGGARCLDLFAGSGALGLEALSRGAAECTFVDSSRRVTSHLRSCVETLGAGDRASIHCIRAVDFLERVPPQAYDVVFLDPPFDAGLLEASCSTVLDRGLLQAPRGAVYLEAPALSLDALPLPPGWAWLRRRRAGAVDFALLAREETPGSA